MKKRSIQQKTKDLLEKDLFMRGMLSKEVIFPARPEQLVTQARRSARRGFKTVRNMTGAGLGLPIASNPAYISWLKSESMLAAANQISKKYSGKADMWHHPYARPRPRSAVKKGSVWYTAYPMSIITKPRQSILAAVGDKMLWEAFSKIGIKAIHTGPMKQAGGIDGWKDTGSVDGHFDRISTRIDDMFGSLPEYQALAKTAEEHGAIVIDDIVPGHTGKGADFRLAEMGVGEYPGIYHMIAIDRQDWHLLPSVPKGKNSVNLDADTEKSLKKAGYIIGRLQRVIFYEPGVKETNWSVTKAIRGVDGVRRRWVYLHYFKEGQPSLNWIDPSFAGMKLVIGDALHSIGDLGASGLRLDANGFLGVEVAEQGTDNPAWSEGHPLSKAANQLIASMVRKVGGFTFQEFNLSVDDIKLSSDLGADLSYDFINRPAYHHALATGDTEFLRMTLRSSHEIGVDPASLVHALQNHDELTYELVHYWTVHNHDKYTFRGKTVTGYELREIIRKELKHKLVDKAAYNKLFGENGIACTNVSAIAAIIGCQSLDKLSEDQVDKITKAHVLLAMFNAWQPGVFALSGWDLVGAMNLDCDTIKPLLSDGDTRWINRGSYDLLGQCPDAKEASSGIPKASALYGSLPEQLETPGSFIDMLHRVLQLRSQVDIDVSKQLEIPDVSDKSLLAMVHELPSGIRQVTVLNFSGKTVRGRVFASQLPPNSTVKCVASGQACHTDSKGCFEIELGAYEGGMLVADLD